MSEQIPKFDPSDFNNQPYAKRISKPWGYEIHWVPESAPYMGKVLHIESGKRLSLQIHDQKQETWFLLSGEAKVEWDSPEGELIETHLQSGQGYSTQIGQRHRLIGVTDCDILEVSTPENGTTWRLEDDFARPHETPQQREIERN
jgi:mannose-6-phosphate isomerase